MTLTIEHTEAEGTLLLGTSRGDGSAEVVKALGWRWGRSIGLWFVPRSRDAAPKRPLIEQTARQLLNSTFMVRDASEDQQPSGNPYDGLVSLVVEPRLSNSNYTGYSTTAWYLFCGPMDAPVVVGFLDGNQTPRTEFFGFDSEPTTLAATWRVYHDFGAALGDYRAAVKSAGA